jgi:transcriptional regulator GlxA family with amidase domain
MTTSEVKHIGILLFSDVEELDAIGPWEVLSYWSRSHPEDGFAVSCWSKAGGLVRCSKGLVVQAHHSYADAPPLEVVVYPGCRGTRPQLEDESQLNWIRQQRRDVPLMTSVCTGSLVFAAAGLLAHRPATTHWASLEKLAELDPTIEVRTDERFVDDEVWSRRPPSPRESTWRCTWCPASLASIEPARFAEESSTTHHRRSGPMPSPLDHGPAVGAAGQSN